MTKPGMNSRDRESLDVGDTVPWANAAGEEIPAYAVVQLRTNVASKLSQASKPDGGSGLFFAAGDVPTGTTENGESLLWNRPRRVLVTGSPVVGTEVGPVEDEWEMSEEGSGFRIMHQPVDGIATVTQVGGSGGGGGHTIWFTIESVLCPEDEGSTVSETTLVIVPTWYNQSCDGEPPGAERQCFV